MFQIKNKQNAFKIIAVISNYNQKNECVYNVKLNFIKKTDFFNQQK